MSCLTKALEFVIGSEPTDLPDCDENWRWYRDWVWEQGGCLVFGGFLSKWDSMRLVVGWETESEWRSKRKWQYYHAQIQGRDGSVLFDIAGGGRLAVVTRSFAIRNQDEQRAANESAKDEMLELREMIHRELDDAARPLVPGDKVTMSSRYKGHSPIGFMGRGTSCPQVVYARNHLIGREFTVRKCDCRQCRLGEWVNIGLTSEASEIEHIPRCIVRRA